jgi:hypothetical protein
MSCAEYVADMGEKCPQVLWEHWRQDTIWKT